MTNPVRIGPEPEETPDNSDHFEIPGVAPAVDMDPATLLADIAADLVKETEGTYVTLAVPTRPDYMLTFRTVIDYDTLRMWIKRARENKKDQDPHMLRLAFAVLSNTNTAILFKGRTVPARAGGNLTLSSPEFLTIVKAGIGNSVPAAIRKFYGRDGHIITVMTRVLEEAGYADIDLEDGGPLMT